MQIVIPMSGFGARFRKAGYTIPKPLIEVDGKPMIAHVLDMFPGEKNIRFICNKDHIKETEMADVLKHYCPTGEIIPIDSHKLGPIYAVSKAFEGIDDGSPTVVNYCDFSCYWNYEHFRKWIDDCGADGCVPAYRGFHPHSLGSTNYAFIREENGWMKQIQEKKPFTENKIEEYASSGTYYFAKGEYIKHFFNEVMKQELSVNGEYYCSVAYNLMIEAGLSVAIYELQHFMQWGTPEDLAEYQRWSKTFKELITAKEERYAIKGTTLIPMAGKGTRFQHAGCPLPKPMLNVTGQPMVLQASKCLPKTTAYHIVALEEHLRESTLESDILQAFREVKFTRLESVTDGQLNTCMKALDTLEIEQALTISACDHGVMYDSKQFEKLMKEEQIDIIVWVTRGHANAIRHPEMYGWVQAESGSITSVSVKKQLENPKRDLMMIGTFTFKNANIFKEAAERLLERNGRVNNEYYVDSCIEDAMALGYKCRAFEIDYYLCWGTPAELNTFKYWQSCFHKWVSHPYTWETDRWRKTFRKEDTTHLSEINSSLPKTREQA
jgi:NDP-sugar pyrophosphorylase family protein